MSCQGQGKPAPARALTARRAPCCAPLPPQVAKIQKLKAMCLEKGCNPWIEVDGGVTPENAYKVGGG